MLRYPVTLGDNMQSVCRKERLKDLRRPSEAVTSKTSTRETFGKACDTLAAYITGVEFSDPVLLRLSSSGA